MRRAPLIVRMFTRSPARYLIIALCAVILLALLAGLALLDGVTFDAMGWEFWRGGAQSPTIIIYILAISPIITGYWDRAIGMLLPLVEESEVREKLEKNLSKTDRLREWGSAILAVAAVLVLSRPTGFPQGWSDWYRFITQFTMIGLLGWLVYTSLRGTRNLARLIRSIQGLDIFNLEKLSPVARWSLGVSLAFIGGITISLFFVPYTSLLNVISITVYGVLLCTTILIFFVSMLSSHNAIVRVKRRELALAQEQLATSLRKLRGVGARGVGETEERVYSKVTAWSVYEEKVRNIREWPYNAGILRTLLASIVSPMVVYLIKVVLGLQFG